MAHYWIHRVSFSFVAKDARTTNSCFRAMFVLRDDLRMYYVNRSAYPADPARDMLVEKNSQEFLDSFLDLEPQYDALSAEAEFFVEVERYVERLRGSSVRVWSKTDPHFQQSA